MYPRLSGVDSHVSMRGMRESMASSQSHSPPSTAEGMANLNAKINKIEMQCDALVTSVASMEVALSIIAQKLGITVNAPPSQPTAPTTVNKGQESLVGRYQLPRTGY